MSEDAHPAPHHMFDAYSGSHKIPTVQDYARRLKEHRKHDEHGDGAAADVSSTNSTTATSNVPPSMLQIDGQGDNHSHNHHHHDHGHNDRDRNEHNQLTTTTTTTTVNSVDQGDNGIEVRQGKTGETAKDRNQQQQANKTEGGKRKVYDPVTGNENVEIDDASRDDLDRVARNMITVPKSNIIGSATAPNTTHPPAFPENNMPSKAQENGVNAPGVHGGAPAHTSAAQQHSTYAEQQDITAPPGPTAPHSTADVPLKPGEKTNLLFHPTPTIALSSTHVLRTLEEKATSLCITIFLTVALLPFLFSLPIPLIGGWGPRLTFTGLLMTLLTASIVTSAVWLFCRGILEQARNIDWASERHRGEIGSANLIPESVEWLNKLVGVAWRLVNPDMFVGVADMLEDVMQASVPGVIENVRVADISQGDTPLRILSLRSLPDHHVKDLRRSDRKEGEDPEQAKAEEMGGEWYNLEASLAYHADPTSDDDPDNKKKKKKGADAAKEKSKNMHLLVVFYVGVRGLFGVPIPIWVELKGLVVTARIRLQMTPDPPYLGQMTFTLMGVPQVSVACLPMSRDQKGVNVLDLPLISNFVDASVKTVASEYVAPKSMSLDLRKMLEGDDVKKDTETLGVVMVRIKRAEGLSRQDRSGGGADAYVTLGWSKFGKPMYSTRVVVGDLNPIWEEVGYLLVKPEHVKSGENLSVELWDSDRFTSDDVVGKLEVPLQSLMLNQGKLHPQTTESLTGLEHNSTLPGKLIWEVGYFPKTKHFRPALRTNGENPDLAKTLQDNPQLADETGAIDTKTEDGVLYTPPDPLWPQGILSVVIHQCVGLEVKNLKGTFKSGKPGREWEPGMADVGEQKEEEGGSLPSAYVTVALNDQLVYRTRTKAVTSKPIFNAGTERFVRDWRSAQVTVVVRDSRLREHDPILGVVPLKISDLLQTKSQVTRWYPLDAGVGFGRIRVSVLWRGLEMSLPRELSGWDVGRVEMTSDYVVGTSTSLSVGKIRLRTGGSVASLSKSAAATWDGGVRWDVRSPPDAKGRQRKLRLPVKHRYNSPVVLEFFSTGGLAAKLPSKAGGSKPVGYAVYWLSNLADNSTTDVDIPIWSCSNPQRLTQNRIERPEDDPDLELKEIGRCSFQCRFIPGMSREHQRFATTNDERELFESWEACYAEGIRSDTGADGRVTVSPTVKRLHDQSIQDLRQDVMLTEKVGGTAALTEQKLQQLTDKYGVSWEEIFTRAMAEFGGRRRDSGYGGPGQQQQQQQHPHGEYGSDRGDNYYSDSGIGGGRARNSSESSGSYNWDDSDASSSTGSDDDYRDPYRPSTSASSATAAGRQQEHYNLLAPSSTRDTGDSQASSDAHNNPVKPLPPPPEDELEDGDEAKGLLGGLKKYRKNQRTLHRRHQGLMQWKPMRSLAFAKDEMKVGLRKVRGKGSLAGREPEVETEV